MKRSFVLFALTAASASAAFTFHLTGSTEMAGWENLSNANPFWAANGFPTSYPGAVAWPAPVAANAAGSAGSAALMKVSGNGYFSGSSIYDAGAPGMFSLSDAAPIQDLATLVFQIDAGTAIGVTPVLNYNGGSQALAAHYFAQGAGDHLTFNFQTGQSFPSVNRAWQWDLTGIEVSSYQIVWGSVANNHLTQYGFQLASSDTFTRVVPEPSVPVIVSVLSLALFRRRR